MPKVLFMVLALSMFTVLVMAQITGPSSVDYALGSYQVTGGNVSGTALSSYGWSLGKKAYLNRPVRVAVRVDSTSGARTYYRVAVNYFGVVDTLRPNVITGAAFWLPVGGADIPDSLFYVVPESSPSAGDEFTLLNTRIQPGDFYSFRLIFSTDTVKGTQTLTSQPIWIGDGVSSLTFGLNPTDSTGIIYRSKYSLTHGGPYLAYASSDTLADSTWTKTTADAGQWNYKSVTGIDVKRWMKVDRIGKAAADTVKITGELIYIQSN